MQQFVRSESTSLLPAPVNSSGPWAWCKANLFNGVFNTIMTLIGLYLVWLVLSNVFLWGFWNATFIGASREACTGTGACWLFLGARWQQFLFGFYPEAERWRVILATVLVIVGFLPLFVEKFEFKSSYMVALVVLYPLTAYFLFSGGTVGVPMPNVDSWLATILWFGAIIYGLYRFVWPAFRPGPAGSVDYLLVVLLSFIPFTFVYLALASTAIWGWSAFLASFGGDLTSVVLSVLLLGGLLGGLYLLSKGGLRQLGSIAGLLVAFPFVAWFVHGLATWVGLSDGAAFAGDIIRYLGTPISLVEVETARWGGLFLTMVLAGVAITSSLPLGIVLALGRRSDMPVVSSLCVVFIELMRGVPLITVLFMSSVMLPLFLPEGVNFDKLLRALVGLSMFAAAYMAEIVRGGLQAISKGQYEAADALGLGYWQKTALIILPQALKIGIPNIVSLFIGLFKDTTLVLIIGLFDFFNSVQSMTSDANWLGLSTEGYVFAAVVYFIFCFSMSRYSMSIERKLDTGHKR